MAVTLRPLYIDVSPLSWGEIDLYHGYTEYSKLSEKLREHYRKVLKRDDYTCQYCGFRSPMFQEVHHINHNHKDYSPNNLITACPLCHRNFHIHAVHRANFGEMIYFPDMTQAQLNHICMALAVAEHRSHDVFLGQHPIAQYAFKEIWINRLKSRTVVFNNIMATERLQNLSAFGEILIDLKKNQPELFDKQNTQQDFINHFKIFHFPESLDFQAAYYSELLPPFEKWDNLGEVLKEQINVKS